ncbi:hypothetical protein PLICRDRAFT_118985 [Plicaturopsis crispa FD-325 SS-3]|uniref:Uncharacterized protein n=1 Tax=Plicaturopsis crispa FD-325 SS-3 TaxID=944288 RepID=A0A0C9SQI7_PLICR|nr:hypothetical protein PLICRDRAFT_118985 [Plicaturopsis crispa FD-325 SS-3]
MSIEPLRASVGHLFSRAYDLPCLTAAQAFSQLVPPTSRFQLALDALLPLLDSQEFAPRILVSFILYSLYAGHPIAINPFRSVLHAAFVRERDHAIRFGGSGGVSENEQLVWVLWKILRGDGNDIGPYSPNTLTRSPLPTKLRAANLTLDDERTITSPYESTSDTSDSSGEFHPSPISHSTPDTSTISEEDERNENIAQAMKLLLAARERVLTLSEQRTLAPMIPQLTSPPMITSLDLLPLISNNPALVQPLFISILKSPHFKNNAQGLSTCLEVLKHLPPTLSSFDLLGRMLRDPTPVNDFATGGRTTVADLIRIEVLGRFIHEAINWLDNAEREEMEGLISDDRFPKGVQNLCRFYTSLIKLSIVDPTSDADSAEMAHFSLRNARFEEANALYRIFAQGKF